MRNASDAEWLPWKGMKLGNGSISLVWSPSGLRLRHLSCMCWRSSWLCFCLAINVLHIDAKVCSQSLWTALYSIIIILSFFWFEDFTTFFFFPHKMSYYKQDPFVFSYISRNEPAWLNYHGFNWIDARDHPSPDGRDPQGWLSPIPGSALDHPKLTSYFWGQIYRIKK